MNPDGSGDTQLTFGLSGDSGDAEPSWSPDGTRIAFTSRRDGNFEVYVMNADGSGQTNITNNPANDSGPEWSPDGTRIAFSSRRDGNRDGNYEVYVMDADGTDQTRVTTTAGGESFEPAWQSVPVVPPTTTTTVSPPTTAPPAVVVAVTATPTFTG
jgi:TolB protein